jgi:hypothetical protein
VRSQVSLEHEAHGVALDAEEGLHAHPHVAELDATDD